MRSSKELKRRFLTAVLALLIAFVAAAAATFAWYVYNTGAHTTRVRMAAGTSTSLQIASQYDGSYGSSAVLEAFTGKLNPVSTNRIGLGFRKVMGFTNGSENRPNLVARFFDTAETSDFYTTSLYLRTNAEDMTVYLSGVGFEDSSAKNPISTAIRLGIVAHEPGENGAVLGEYIFAINTEDHIDNPKYNTYDGVDGYVLDLTKEDTEAIVPFEPYNSENYCEYDKTTGLTTLRENSLPLCRISGDGDEFGASARLEIYIWLEGCDQDCTDDLMNTTLKNLALSFAGVSE